MENRAGRASRFFRKEPQVRVLNNGDFGRSFSSGGSRSGELPPVTGKMQSLQTLLEDLHQIHPEGTL